MVNTFKVIVEKMFSGVAAAKEALVITLSKLVVVEPSTDKKYLSRSRIHMNTLCMKWSDK